MTEEKKERYCVRVYAIDGTYSELTDKLMSLLGPDIKREEKMGPCPYRTRYGAINYYEAPVRTTLSTPDLEVIVSGQSDIEISGYEVVDRGSIFDGRYPRYKVKDDCKANLIFYITPPGFKYVGEVSVEGALEKAYANASVTTLICGEWTHDRHSYGYRIDEKDIIAVAELIIQGIREKLNKKDESHKAIL